MSSIYTKEDYAHYTEEYVKALKSSVEATAEYEIAKHKTRLKLYAKKQPERSTRKSRSGRCPLWKMRRCTSSV